VDPIEKLLQGPGGINIEAYMEGVQRELGYAQGIGRNNADFVVTRRSGFGFVCGGIIVGICGGPRGGPYRGGGAFWFWVSSLRVNPTFSWGIPISWIRCMAAIGSNGD
jgi:hypothetical protein